VNDSLDSPWDEYERNKEESESESLVPIGAIPYLELTLHPGKEELTIAADFIGAYYRVENKYTVLRCFNGPNIHVYEDIKIIDAILGITSPDESDQENDSNEI
jgi:hypothetical protein